ncbi:DUF6262 family protein [Streptomyces anulatus]|uniref:DUF6262 family protein n=1 Tax=Streptomyces anulatus TaxID=1892 RepID=UPI0036344B8D
MSQSRTPAEVLRQARQRDSRAKRGKVLAVIEELLEANEPVTPTTVARAAGVSSWLVYADGVREHIEVARKRQAQPGTAPGRAAPAGLRIEMGLVREENSRLRQECTRLKVALQRNLGQELDRLGTADLTTRVDELVGDNQQLNRDLIQARERVRDLEAQLAETQDDLVAVRGSLRKMIKEGRQPAQ